MADDEIVFICGALRSGTTLLGLMVDHHPKLSNPGEKDFLFDRPPARAGGVTAKDYRAWLATDRIFRSSRLDVDEALDIDELVRSFVRQLRKPGKKLIINVHRNFQRIPALFPEARYVHLLRDPRDVALSAVAMGWAGNAYFGVDHWVKSERDFSALAATVDDSAILTLKFQDLVSRPEAELSRLCQFIGVDYDAAMLSYPADSAYGAPEPAMAGKWRRHGRPKEIALVETKIAEMMSERGYLVSGYAKQTPGAVKRLALKTHNRLGRLAFSVRRYGFGLTLLEILGRRFGISAVANYAQRRIDDRTISFLK